MLSSFVCAGGSGRECGLLWLLLGRRCYCESATDGREGGRLECKRRLHVLAGIDGDLELSSPRSASDSVAIYGGASKG